MSITQGDKGEMTGLLFIIAGLIWCIAALVARQPLPDVPIGMMFVAIGLMFSVNSRPPH